MRLFVAINLPENVKNYLKSIQSLLPSAKMSLTKDFHLTLQFIGEATLDQAMEIKSALYHVFMPKMTFKLGKIGVFKSRGYINVALIDLECPKELLRVQSEVEEQLAPLGFFKDKPFKPHLTLARVKFCDDKKFEEAISHIKIEPTTFTADTFELMESYLSQDGATYSVIETFKS